MKNRISLKIIITNNNFKYKEFPDSFMDILDYISFSFELTLFKEYNYMRFNKFKLMLLKINEQTYSRLNLPSILRYYL